MKIVTVVGARPQFIKAAMVSRALPKTVLEIMVHTGQHYDYNMSTVFFEQMDIPEPDYHLGIGSGPHGQQTGRMMEAVEAVLFKEQPDTVLVYGDTNSTLAGALTAAKLHIPVAHVEAGMRSYNWKMPEEVNRKVTDHVSHYLFTSTQTASRNLLKEGINTKNVYLVGDVMYDAALHYSKNVTKGNYILATIHRAENTDNPERLYKIFDALNEVGNVICPLHPRTRKMLRREYDRIVFLDPVGYSKMLALEKGAQVIVTDSGGVQKEAYFFRVPCVTVRNETEWVELVDGGWNQLVEPEGIKDAILRSAWCVFDVDKYVDYGGGNASRLIADVLGGKS